MSETPENAVRRPDWDAETVARFWDYWGRRNDRDDWYFSHTHGPALIELARQAGVLGGRVLDYGCARGVLTDKLLDVPGLTVEALDFSPETIAAVEERFRGRERWGGGHVAGSLPSDIPAGRYDLIYCVEVYEHLIDDWLEPTAAEIARLLAPGGHAVVTTPFAEDLRASDVFCPFCCSEFHRVQHVRRAEAGDLKAWLRRAGLEVAFCEPVDLARFRAWPRGPVWSRRGLRDYVRDLPIAFAAVLDAVVPRRDRPSRAFEGAADGGGANLLAIAKKAA